VQLFLEVELWVIDCGVQVVCVGSKFVSFKSSSNSLESCKSSCGVLQIYPLTPQSLTNLLPISQTHEKLSNFPFNHLKFLSGPIKILNRNHKKFATLLREVTQVSPLHQPPNFPLSPLKSPRKCQKPISKTILISNS
jgi:hypothetical protein